MRRWRLEMLTGGPLCDKRAAIYFVHPSSQSPTDVVCVEIEMFA